ncbi:MAG: hypothetical protein ACK4S4_09645 [Pyrinomonadaceae bacterium]
MQNRRLELFRSRFGRVHERSAALIQLVPDERLYWRPRETPNSMAPFSCGEFVLRSAGVVEQTFGGITTRLWDDPFEWTLPEKLSTKASVLEYLADVEATTEKGFAFLASDESLDREIPAPTELRQILAILVETLAAAEHFQGRAYAIFGCFSDEKLPRP